ncbi:hypothetical protein LCGC14_0658440, partial [marine sediment metagenome]
NSLKNKISQNQRDVATLEENNNELTTERQILLEKIKTAQNELNETQSKITSKKEESTNRNSRLEELESRITELKDLQEKFDNKMKQLESQLQAELNKKERFSNSYAMRTAAMKSLIKSGYVQSAQLQVIKALVPQKTLELKGLISASGLREDTFRSILSKIVQNNGPIEYDETEGTVTLLGEVDF